MTIYYTFSNYVYKQLLRNRRFKISYYELLIAKYNSFINLKSISYNKKFNDERFNNIKFNDEKSNNIKFNNKRNNIRIILS